MVICGGTLGILVKIVKMEWIIRDDRLKRENHYNTGKRCGIFILLFIKVYAQNVFKRINKVM